MITLFGIRNCDSIKKTRNWLEHHGIDYDFHDYKKSGCQQVLARRMLSQIDSNELINKRGTTWRKLPEASKQDLDRAAIVSLMQEYPSIIKRPVIAFDDTWIVGFDEERLHALLIDSGTQSTE